MPNLKNHGARDLEYVLGSLLLNVGISPLALEEIRIMNPSNIENYLGIYNTIWEITHNGPDIMGFNGEMVKRMYHNFNEAFPLSLELIIGFFEI